MRSDAAPTAWATRCQSRPGSSPSARLCSTLSSFFFVRGVPRYADCGYNTHAFHIGPLYRVNWRPTWTLGETAIRRCSQTIFGEKRWGHGWTSIEHAGNKQFRFCFNDLVNNRGGIQVGRRFTLQSAGSGGGPDPTAGRLTEPQQGVDAGYGQDRCSNQPGRRVVSRAPADEGSSRGIRGVCRTSQARLFEGRRLDRGPISKRAVQASLSDVNALATSVLTRCLR